eukprot:6763165-Prymnesium_polylepis.2
MRDEIREVSPGLYFGLGSMAATGGPRNAAPFVLAQRGASPRRSGPRSGTITAMAPESRVLRIVF